MPEPSNNKATLGCGTLILIALIVVIFGNRGNEEVRTELQNLTQRIEQLETKIDKQTERIVELTPTDSKLQTLIPET